MAKANGTLSAAVFVFCFVDTVVGMFLRKWCLLFDGYYHNILQLVVLVSIYVSYDKLVVLVSNSRFKLLLNLLLHAFQDN